MKTLLGKKAFVAGVADDQGYGWAIARALSEAGATVFIGTWVPTLGIFEKGLSSGKFENPFPIAGIYPMDASFDAMDEVPQEIRENKRYKDLGDYALKELAEKVAKEHGPIDIIIHSLANAPEVRNSLLETSRAGYLAALSASAYSFISLVRHFGPHMSAGACALTLSYIAAEKAVPGYGGGMSSAKAALESDVKTLAFEAGRRWGMRINAISAGALPSRAAKAIGFIEKMCAYAEANAPLEKPLSAREVANVAVFLSSPLASAVTGTCIYVDNGLHAMGVSVDSPTLYENSHSAAGDRSALDKPSSSSCSERTPSPCHKRAHECV